MEALISVRSLEKSYKGRPALEGISFEVREGEILAFLGPNGAGKTTVINILTGLIRQDSGEVSFYNTPFDPENIRHKKMIGLVPQNNNLEKDLTVSQNLRIHALLFGISDYSKCIDEVLDIVELKEQKDQNTSELSGGMKRRLVIARALMHKPSILFLDEPSTGLDPVSRRNIHSLIRRLNREGGTSVFLTTHYIEEADMLASRVLFIDRGRIVTEGTPEALKAELGKYALEHEGLNGLSLHYFNDREGAVQMARGLTGEVKIREVSLEDPYIKYTGRKLDV